jgi:cardiolipin synthase
VAAALEERVAAGVDCRLLYDFVGSSGTPGEFFEELRHAGVSVHAYHTLWHALSRFSLFRVFNRRTHRKLLVIDDQVGYFGGMNVVDQSQLRTPSDVNAARLPASAGWRDVHLRLEGPRQREIAQAFDRLWRRTHGLSRRRAAGFRVQRIFAQAGESLHFFDTRPERRRRRADRVLAPLIARAEKRITLAMAYFIPHGAVLRALVRARRRGVTVRVIIPEESDVKLVQWCTRHLYARFLRRGIRVFERREEMLHSKVMVVDDCWSVVGSCNLDPRSLRFNLEFFAVISSKPLALELTRICAHEMRRSRRVTWALVRGRTWWQRWRDRFAWWWRRWL